MRLPYSQEILRESFAGMAYTLVELHYVGVIFFLVCFLLSLFVSTVIGLNGGRLAASQNVAGAVLIWSPV